MVGLAWSVHYNDCHKEVEHPRLGTMQRSGQRDCGITIIARSLADKIDSRKFTVLHAARLVNVLEASGGVVIDRCVVLITAAYQAP